MVSSLGSPTYDLAAAGDHDRNFYLWGAMGGATALALGLALAQPETPVLALLGDGEALMGMGSLATVGMQNPPNLSIVVLDNGLFGETGGQISHTSVSTDLAKVAAACGITETQIIWTVSEVDALAEKVNAIRSSALVGIVKIDGREMSRVLPSRDGIMLKGRLRAALGYPSM